MISLLFRQVKKKSAEKRKYSRPYRSRATKKLRIDGSEVVASTSDASENRGNEEDKNENNNEDDDDNISYSCTSDAHTTSSDIYSKIPLKRAS